MELVWWLGLAVVLAIFVVGLLYRGLGYFAWVIPGALVLAAWSLSSAPAVHPAFWPVAGVFGFAVVVFGVPAIRRQLVSRPVLPMVAAMLPRMGDTEREALDAGTVWFDGDLFSGRPDWRTLLAFKPKALSDRERAFLDGPVERLCAMLDEWKITQDRDLSPEVWAYLKEHGFFGMIIPESFGGLGFSAAAHSAVVMKVASRSGTASVTVMVPNSLGPAELLLHYGTEEQKRHYLPRLATGEEIPCFALTGPEAGSDAAATQSVGIVCRDTWEGKEVLGMRLTWNKRYITLGPVATVVGLAFRLKDPDRLLGGEENLGITCALIPAKLPGVDIGRRHDPLGIPFQNGPNSGKDVFVPLEFIIGGQAMAGKGWRMLMDSLSAGRSISLPSVSASGAQVVTRLVGAYGTVREQFDTPIGRFEGIEEPLARIGGLTYLVNAARRLTVGAVDAGEKPSVLSAIVKAYLTEIMRTVVNDAMDIRAGAGISRGPRNVLARLYASVPIGITVEGANILTRTMIIYGQGAIRCHPFVQKEMDAARTRNLPAFDRAFFGHVNHTLWNATRAWVLGLTGARIAVAPHPGPVAGYYRKLSRASSCFAIVSDVAMATLGGGLKRREKISGRLADVLAWMYLASASLKSFADAGSPKEDLAMVRWACEHSLHQIDRALHGILANLPNRPAAWVLKRLVFPVGRHQPPPNDSVGTAVARGLLEDRGARERLSPDIYVPPRDEPGLGRLEAALDKAVGAIAVETRVRDAVRAGKLDHAPGEALLAAAVQAGVITEEERNRVREADEIRNEVIQVDSFDAEEFRTLR